MSLLFDENLSPACEGFLCTVRADVPFDPYTRDGRGTIGLQPAKSNWANAIDR